MADAHHPGRHRGERRGRLGPVVSAVAVLLATAPAAWFMTHDRDGTSVADAPTELESSYDGRQPARPGEPGYDPTPSDVPAGRPTAPPVSRGKARPTTAPSTPSSTVTASPTPTRTDEPSRSRPTGDPRPTVTATTPTRRPTSPASTPTPTRQPQPGPASPEETEVLRLTNAERSKAGCGPLTADPNLLASAGGHAEDMVDRHYFDHTNPDGEDPFERIRAAGFRGSSMGENIAMGYGSPQAAVKGWMESSGHRKNILNCDYNRLGVGYDSGRIQEGYSSGSWVQNFGRR